MSTERKVKISSGNKRKIQSEMLEQDVKKQELELKLIKELLMIKSSKEEEVIVSSLKEKPKKTFLKPFENKQDKPIKLNSIRSDLNQKSSVRGIPSVKNNFETKECVRKNILNESNHSSRSQSRQKTEKIEIDDKQETMEDEKLMSFRFDDQEEIESDEFESIFNNKVRKGLQKEFSIIYEFLQEINLESFLEKFIENGFDSMKKILDIQEDDPVIDKFEMKLGQKVKLSKRIKELREISLNEDSKIPNEPIVLEVSNDVHPNNKLTKKKIEISKKHSIGIGTIEEESQIHNNSDNEEKDSVLENIEKIDLKNIGDKTFNFFGIYEENEDEAEYEPNNKGSVMIENQTQFEEMKAGDNFMEDSVIFTENIEIKHNIQACWQCFSIREKSKMIFFEENWFCDNVCLTKSKSNSKSTCKNCGKLYFFEHKNRSEEFCSLICQNQFNEYDNDQHSKSNKDDLNENEDDCDLVDYSYDPMSDF